METRVEEMRGEGEEKAVWGKDKLGALSPGPLSTSCIGKRGMDSECQKHCAKNASALFTLLRLE